MSNLTVTLRSHRIPTARSLVTVMARFRKTYHRVPLEVVLAHAVGQLDSVMAGRVQILGHT